MTLDDLPRRIFEGDRSAAARAVTLLENEGPGADRLLKEIYPRSGKARVIGITGPPGAGKSTLLAALLESSPLDPGKTAVLLCDPSSPKSGGAVLGGRPRFSAAVLAKGIFIRSLAARGTAGGLPPSVWGARRVAEALGMETIFVETVGAGQGESSVARFADSVVGVLTPNSGDEIQAIKAGLPEFADVLVLNKSDLADRERTLAALRAHVGPVLPTVASTGQGVPALWKLLEEHRAALESGGELRRRRRIQAESELAAALESRVKRGRDSLVSRTEEEAGLLLSRRGDPGASAKRLAAALAKKLAT